MFGDRIPCGLKRTEALLNMLRVSHQYYNEAMVAFYSSSCFYFKDVVPFLSLLDRLPIDYQNLIRELNVYIFVDEVQEWSKLFKHRAAAHFPGLRNVRITIEVPARPNTSIYRNLGNFGKLRIESSMSLPMLREAIIGITVYRVEHLSHSFNRNVVKILCQWMAERFGEV